jgi:O-antigen/teichoic acid export membrane protein
MFSVGGFYILSGFGNMLITYIDRYMINFFLGLGLTGIYSVTNYVGTLVQIPRRAMGKVASPVLAGLWAKNNVEELQKIYNWVVECNSLFSGTWSFYYCYLKQV